MNPKLKLKSYKLIHRLVHLYSIFTFNLVHQFHYYLIKSNSSIKKMVNFLFVKLKLLFMKYLICNMKLFD